VFDLKTKEGEEPVPSPIRDAKGDVDQTKLKNNGIGEDGEDMKTDTKIKVTPSKVKVKKK
jgi:hypothetical protein